MNITHLLSAFCIAGALSFGACTNASSDNKLVILHTNDTHSQIEPDRNNLGGIMRRMAVIDSIRRVDSNVLVVDAGDVVQGTLYFYLYGGKVEQELLNAMGVDIRILGNHEFDNGIDSLASALRASTAEKISSNYVLDATPLSAQFVPYSIRTVGDKRVGFIGINLDPDGIISKGNYDGLEFSPIVETANSYAQQLREDEHVDYVVALTHIGYAPSGLVGDSILAHNSRGIDVIIGGHSHDEIDPTTEIGYRRSHMQNLDGRPVLVVQTGKAGRKLGKIEIDLDSLNSYPSYELITIDSRYDNYSNSKIEAIINKYSNGIDSLMHHRVGYTEHALAQDCQELHNFFADFVFSQGAKLAKNVDLSITNKGGIRTSLPEGDVSEGDIINMLPFRNYLTIIDIKGEDLKEAFEVMARRLGDDVSSNVHVTYSSCSKGDATVLEILINGKPLDENRTYRVATIDYLAKGGDYMTPLTRATIVTQSKNAIFDDLLNYLTTGDGANKPISASSDSHWTRK